MTFFLAECAVPNKTYQEVKALLRTAAEMSEQIAGPGLVVRFIRALYVPGDDHLLCLYTASDATLVRDVNEAAQLPFLRIVEALEIPA